MTLAVPKMTPEAVETEVRMKPGAWAVIFLFAATIVTAVSFRNFLDLPPALGMMTGLGYLSMYSYFFKVWVRRNQHADDRPDILLDAFKVMERVEWDTLLRLSRSHEPGAL